MCSGMKFSSEFFAQLFEDFCAYMYCISGSIRPITLIWASLERAFLQQKLSIDDANFGQK